MEYKLIVFELEDYLNFLIGKAGLAHPQHVLVLVHQKAEMCYNLWDVPILKHCTL
jgi:hypothetical protein